jgi:hypothetical protein
MSYQDRLRTMNYTSPSGQSFTLQFSDLSRTGGKKAPVTEFPGQNQGSVQDLGNVTPTFPVSCWISGADYDLDADRFYDAVHETGPGDLSHPRWGDLKVLPILNTQSESFVNGARRATFDLTFIRVDEKSFTYPQASIDYQSSVTANTDNTVIAIAESVPTEITDTRALAGLKESVTDTLDSVVSAFDNISGLTDDIRTEIDQTVRDITTNIDTLVTAPADLMTAMLKLYRLPGAIIVDVNEKLDSYNTIYTNLIDGFVSQTQQYGFQFGLVSVANIAGLNAANAEAANYGFVSTRDQAGNNISELYRFNGRILTSIEDLEEAGDFASDYNLQLTMGIGVTDSITGLIDQSLNLPAERVEILDREVTPIQFVYEKYGNLENLELFISYNALQGCEILLLPRGKSVRWYNVN